MANNFKILYYTNIVYQKNKKQRINILENKKTQASSKHTVNTQQACNKHAASMQQGCSKHAVSKHQSQTKNASNTHHANIWKIGHVFFRSAHISLYFLSENSFFIKVFGREVPSFHDF